MTSLQGACLNFIHSQKSFFFKNRVFVIETFYDEKQKIRVYKMTIKLIYFKVNIILLSILMYTFISFAQKKISQFLLNLNYKKLPKPNDYN